MKIRLFSTFWTGLRVVETCVDTLGFQPRKCEALKCWTAYSQVVEQPNAPEIQSTIRHFRQQLYQICAPETIDARVKADQRARRRELAQSGRLFDEMWKRGYEKNPDQLIHRPNIALEYPSVY